MGSSSTASLPVTVSRRLASAIQTCDVRADAAIKETIPRLVLDVAGLCIAVRDAPYVQAALAAVDQPGPCRVLGSGQRLGVEAAAFVNGVAAHGEDFDDTYEGGPVHVGAVIVPALLAVAQKHDLRSDDLLRGMAVGAEVMCRLCRVAPMAVHKAGFHPTAIFGVMGAVAGIGAALRLTQAQLVDAFGIAGSMASGIIEYLADGSWTKRMHPGWAAQSGYRAVRLAQAGFRGPATVFEGEHGLFFGFANTRDGDFEAMLSGFGREWLHTTLAFKPYACGTMAHPFIDCALMFRKQGVAPERIARIDCDTAEGIVHRLWEPAALKALPPNGYAAKFSIPYAIAVAILRGDAGLADYTDEVVTSVGETGLAGKVRYRVDPRNPYPERFVGHLRITLTDGQVLEYRQDFFQGGADHPLSTRTLQEKFLANCRHGGYPDDQSEQLMHVIARLFDNPVPDLSAL